MELRFEQIWALYLLWLVPAALVWWIFLRRRTDQALERFIAAPLRSKLLPGSAPSRFYWQAGLLAAAVLLMLTAAAQPQWGTRQQKVYQRGRDLVIALDVSRSMLANDVRPSRLQRAKLDLLDLIDVLKGDRAALVAFRFKGNTVCPLTSDYAFLRHALDGMDINSAPRGETDIADAIQKALAAFDNANPSHKAVILISDGEDLTGKAKQAAEKAAEQKIPIFTVGIGSAQGSKIPSQDGKGFMSHKGQDIVTKLDNNTLLEIARLTGGAYIPLETASTASTTLGTLYKDYLSKVAEQDLEESMETLHVERYQVFLFPAILLAMAAVFLSRGRLAASSRATTAASVPATTPQPAPLKDLNPAPRVIRSAGALLCAALLLPQDSWAQTQSVPRAAAGDQSAPEQVVDTNSPAMKIGSDVQPGREGARKAQSYYQLGRYAEAAEAYQKAAEGSAVDARDEYLFNAAVALIRAGKNNEAVNLLDQLNMPGADNKTRWNQALGSALFRDTEATLSSTNKDAAAMAETSLRRAGDAFAESLRLSGNSPEVEQNINRILHDLPGVAETSKISRLLQQYRDKDAYQISDSLLSSQRTLLSGLESALTNTSPEMITRMETLSAQQKDLSDLWIPLKEKLLSAASNAGSNSAQLVSEINRAAEITRDRMNSAATGLRDLDPDSMNNAILSEQGTYLLWKGVAPPQGLISEAIHRQTNSINLQEKPNPMRRDLNPAGEQDETAGLTDLFRQRFEQMYPPEQAAQPMPSNGSTNSAAEPNKLTAEDRQKILDLTDKAINSQKQALNSLKSGGNPAADQKASREFLQQIEKLLPRQDQQQQQDQQKQDQQDNKQQPPQPKDQQKPEDPKENQENQQNDQEQPPEDVQKMMDKALQREKDHEAEKKKRMQQAPPSPIERDW